MDPSQIIELLRQMEKEFERLCTDAEVIKNASPAERGYTDFERGRLEGKYQAYQLTYRILKSQIDKIEKLQQSKVD